VDCKHGFACPNRGGSCLYRHPQVSCKFGSSCLHGASCIFSHYKPCKSKNLCSIPGCKFGHPGDETDNTAQQQHNDQNLNTAVEKLSESLTFTPPRENEEEEKM